MLMECGDRMGIGMLACSPEKGSVNADGDAD